MQIFFPIITNLFIHFAYSVKIGQIIDNGPMIGKYKTVLDANWRWVHYPNGYKNCYDTSWNCGELCDECELEGVELENYKNKYGISSDGTILELQFAMGSNVGSRLYLLENDKYWFPDLLNKQISIDIDISEIPCGMNAAVYLVEMKSTELDKLGIGYGDAQCPVDIKYLKNGKPNTKNEQRCQVEIDLIEANTEAMAWTLHPCNGDNCDKSGADANSYRQNYTNFFGKNKIINTLKPMTVITQFIGNPLKEIKRFYKQDNKIIEHPGGSLTKESINKWKTIQYEPNNFELFGGFDSLTKAITNGMVFVLSIWDDPLTNMKWLDSGDRGPCNSDENLRDKYKNVKVKFSNIILGNLENFIITQNIDDKQNIDNTQNKNFCCFSYSNIDNPCYSCYQSAKVYDNEWCRELLKNCMSCSKDALWCETKKVEL
jgi:cellulose 1,4-beta-cellobiosidase